MENRIAREKRLIKTVLLVFAILIGITSVSYLIYREYEYKTCYNNLGKEFNVEPNYIAVSEAILTKINSQQVSGLSKDEVMESLDQIATAKTLTHRAVNNGT